MTTEQVVMIAAAIIAALVAAVGIVWRRSVEVERSHKRDLHKVIGWPKSGDPEPSDELAEPPSTLRNPPKPPRRRR